jgi:hypothetical protein
MGIKWLYDLIIKIREKIKQKVRYYQYLKETDEAEYIQFKPYQLTQKE